MSEVPDRPSSRWPRAARAAALIVLLAVTAIGLLEFFAGDWRQALGYWRAHLPLLALVLLFAVLDNCCEGIGCIWVYERFGIRARDAKGWCAFLSARAGLLLPAQLGRLIRPDSLVRLGRGALPDCLKAEAVAFALNGTSVLGLLAGVAAYRYLPDLAPGLAAAAVPAGIVGGAAAIAAILAGGNLAARALSGTRLALPDASWWRWETAAIVLVQMGGLIAHAIGMYVLVRGLSPEIPLWKPLFLTPASALVGAGTGLPGGVGATEGLLGVSLGLMAIPDEHKLPAVAAFRLITFWIWIPVGWLALAALRRGAPAGPRPAGVAGAVAKPVGAAGEH